MNSGKKPPIKLSDLKGEEVREAKPGEITYLGIKKGGGGISGDKDKWVQLFGSVVVSLVLAAIMVVGYSAGKQDVSKLEESITKVSGRLEDTNSKIDTEVASLSSKVDKAVVEARSAKNSLSNLATKDSIPEVDTFVEFRDLEGYIEEDTERIEALESLVKDLRDELSILRGELESMEESLQ